MRRSDAVREGIRDPGAFEAGLASGQGVSVIGTGPAEGHGSRDDWIAAYRSGIAELGVKLRGDDPVGFEQDAVCYCTDTPSFVFPDGSRLPTLPSRALPARRRRRVPRWAARSGSPAGSSPCGSIPRCGRRMRLERAIARAMQP